MFAVAREFWFLTKLPENIWDLLIRLLTLDLRLLATVRGALDWLLNTVRKSVALAEATLFAGNFDWSLAVGGVCVVCNVVLNVGMT